MKLWVKLVHGLNRIELVFNTDDSDQLESLVADAGYGDWKVTDWELKEIKFIEIY